ncbi:MAG: zinc dependent phospholipase C family protein [Bacteroidia bacterium]|nr:zinc dependent phospholipase C family protein [Bacteroidia bacterium]
MAYSVLTHEAIVDAAWDKTIQPLLQQKYPGLTEEQLKEAHSYAYGGAIAPDMGYFPLGNRFFTDLVHYIRSGDFVNALLADAHDVNEYAFALGFLSHYMADMYGHFLGTNRCVPIVYPRMMRKFGSFVTYEEDQISHKRMEFAFDVLQTVKGNYASKAYHDFIGFNVSRSLLERVFRKIYGLDLNSGFKNLTFSIKIFRLSVKSLFPVLTKAAWVTKKDEILKLEPTATSRSFKNKMSRANYYQESGQKQKRPGFFTNGLSWLIRVLPKTGPLKSLKFKEPGIEGEKLFIQSFDTVLINFNSSLKLLGSENIILENIDFDTGYNTTPGEYELADVTYGKLIIMLRKINADQLHSGLKQNIIEFYSNPKAAIAAKNERIEWKRITRALKRLNLE